MTPRFESTNQSINQFHLRYKYGKTCLYYIISCFLFCILFCFFCCVSFFFIFQRIYLQCCTCILYFTIADACTIVVIPNPPFSMFVRINQIEDEQHFLIHCTKFANVRKLLLKKLNIYLQDLCPSEYMKT
jgi:hypothetical protein